jgi:hypothetical protein
MVCQTPRRQPIIDISQNNFYEEKRKPPFSLALSYLRSPNGLPQTHLLTHSSRSISNGSGPKTKVENARPDTGIPMRKEVFLHMFFKLDDCF